MSSDLALRSVSKRFVAGTESCSVEVTALRDASVEIRAGEILIIAGPIGSGKTTLLLCAAGLLSCDAGGVYGGARRVAYRDLEISTRPIDPPTRSTVLLLDSCDRLAELAKARAARVIGQAVAIGASVVLAGRDASACLELVPPTATVSVVHLRLGQSSTAQRFLPSTRVAEGAGRY
jgi:energy-coupling factor transporter ATP-binding protein EcfA2